jgi:hypothetical protein
MTSVIAVSIANINAATSSWKGKIHAPQLRIHATYSVCACRDVVPITELVEFDRGHVRMKRKRLVDQKVSTGSSKT